MPRILPFICLVFASLQLVSSADEHVLVEFSRQQLTDTYFSEGSGAGDINGDGHVDVVYGPYWFAGPDFKTRHEIYPAVPQRMQGYADHFFHWVYDFDGDGHPDVLTAGFPGTPGYVYRNPGSDQLDRLWEKLTVADQVSNEAPQFADITGDGIPELVCTRSGHYGYYRPNESTPLEPWTFVSISDAVAPHPFGHGLGVGDVNNDGRADLLARDGWFEQPEQTVAGENWRFHPHEFAHSSADMFVYDVDGDGDNDIITSLRAHDYGLAWFENTGQRDDGSVIFKRHLLMGDKPEDSPYGLVFTELHAVQLADINGDGLKDIITGKTYWSHHKQSPMWDAGAVVYWFELQRNADGSVDFIPHLADGEAGIGRGLTIADVNKDGLPDMITGGMLGGHVLIQSRRTVGHEEFEQAQPRKTVAMAEGLEPQAAAAQMRVPPGFKVQLAASEPMVHQPVAMCFDHKGRLWIAEAHTYPQRAEEGQGRDKLLILEDTNGDGVFDHSKTFIEGLNLVSGLEVGFGGVYVGAPPYLMFIPDANGDDIPDGLQSAAALSAPGRSPVENGQTIPVSLHAVASSADLQFPGDVPPGAIVLRDGFGWHDTHETLNAFIWGPDGWLYGCHGVFTHSKVGRPGDTDDQRLPLNCAVWRYHPIKDIFEAFANGTSNPWGVDFNDRGQAFISACVIPHLWHIIQGGRYHRQGGRHFNEYTYDDIKTIADHAHYVGDIRDHAWWGHEPRAAGGTSEAGGGHAHAGAMVYLGDNWPDQYRNHIFFNNIHGNRVNSDLLEKVEGESGYVGRHGKDLLFANDHYFRGINLRYAADGSVYLIDWYDKNACHRANPEIWDRTNGRVYRVSYSGSAATVTKSTQPDVSADPLNVEAWTESQLLAAHEHRNEWFTRMSRRTLMHKGCSAEGRAILWKQASNTSLPVEHRLRSLWTLHALDGFTEDQAAMLLADEDEYLRAWTIQLQLEDFRIGVPLHQQMVTMAAKEPSAVVRMYLASALQRMPLASRWPLATHLAAHQQDADDHNIPLLLWYGVEPLVPADAGRAMQLAMQTKIPLLQRYIVRRASAQNDTIDAVVSALNAASPDTQRLIMDEMLASFEGRVGIPMPAAWQSSFDQLNTSGQQDLADKASQLAIIFGDQRVYPRMRSLLADPSQDVQRRRQALDVLVRGQDKASADVLLSDAVLLNGELRSAAIRALSSLGSSSDSVPTRLLAKFQSFDESTRADVISTLVSRPQWATALLNAVGAGHVPSNQLHAYHVRQVLAFNNASLNELLKRNWGEIRESSADKKQLVADWKQRLTAASLKEAHLGNGRRVFAKTCQNCHRLFGTGGEIGPDITGSNRANLDYILENILDPGAVVGRDYQMTVVALQDGRVISGLLRQETDSALTIQTINDKVVVPKSEIEDRALSTVSMMPEGQLNAMTPEEARDLIAYLASPVQVPLSGPPSEIDAQTGKVSGAIEAENMKIVGKTGGTARSQAMNNFKADRWSGDHQLWWTGGKPGDMLSLELPVEADGVYTVELVFTKARDYGMANIAIDDQLLEGSIDFFNQSDVITTGVLSYPNVRLNQGVHVLNLQITGANEKAVKGYMVALDYVRLIAADAAAE